MGESLTVEYEQHGSERPKGKGPTAWEGCVNVPATVRTSHGEG